MRPWLTGLPRLMALRNARPRRRMRSAPVAAERLEDRTLLAAFLVNTTVDTVDANPGDGVAADSSGDTSLRAAIMEANALAGDDTITLPAGIYTRSRAGSDNTAVSGDLDITDTTGALTINGSGSGLTIIDANSIERVFHVVSSATLILTGVTVTGGNGDGGGVYVNGGTLEVADSEIAGNSTSGSGAGIFNQTGTVTITDSVVADNSAGGTAGGLFNNAGQGTATMTIVRSTVSGNTSGYEGGGVFSGYVQSASSEAVLTITDSTISNNSAEYIGGGLFVGGGLNASTATITGTTIAGNTANAGSAGIHNSGNQGTATVILTNSTISGNTTPGNGGGLRNSPGSGAAIALIDNATITGNAAAAGGGIDNGGTVVLGNTVISGNTAANGPDFKGTMTSNGHNLFGVSSGGGGFDGSDLLDVDPLLGPLADNGGPTHTHELLAFSPAIDAGNFSVTLLTDQRGVSRPQGGFVDIGAFEVESTPATTVELPDGGGRFEFVVDGGDVVVRREGGEELFREDLGVASSILIDGSDEDDTLIVDFSAGNPITGSLLRFAAGAHSSAGDSLELVGGSANTVRHTFEGADSGYVLIDTDWVVYSGLEPTTGGAARLIDQLTAADRLFVFGGAADDVTLEDNPTPNDGTARISSASSSQTVDFVNPTGTLAINLGDGDDTLTLDSVDAQFAASLSANGDGDNDSLNALSIDRGVSLSGGAGHDTLVGSLFDDTLDGESGDDALNGSLGNDVLSGGGGNDSAHGGAGRDTLDGGAGNDLLNGQGYADTLTGGAGNDTLKGGADADRIVEANASNFTLADNQLTGHGVDLLDSIEQAQLTADDNSRMLDARAFSGDVKLIGGSRHDTLYGGSGNDELLGGDGHDWLDGGSGDDCIDAGNGNDVVAGGEGNDIINGAKGHDTLLGGDGDDSLFGGAGNDVLLGEAGIDNVTGHAGTDTVAGGGNGIAADPGDSVDGEVIDDDFIFDAPWVNV